MKRLAAPALESAAAARVAALQARFAEIARTRMAGVPLLNPQLAVEAIGFTPLPAAEGEAAAPAMLLGVLVTPWFMNLVLLPVRADDAVTGYGRTQRRVLAGETFDFIGAHEPGIGAHAGCSLFSPMHEFGDATAARMTALAVLDLLRPSAPAAPAVQAVQAAPALPARRGFLFGRSATAGARA